jgi:hypothetical protein
VNAARRPKRYILRAIGCFAIAVAGIVLGTVASAHHMDALNGLAVGIVGVALGFTVAMLAGAYKAKVPVPRQARRLIAVSEALDAGQALSGKFKAFLRDPTQGVPSTRWTRGRVKITPQSLAWEPAIGRARDLTDAQCVGVRAIDRNYADMTLWLPTSWQGENVRVMTLRSDGTDLELAAPAQLLEIIRSCLTRTTPGAS